MKSSFVLYTEHMQQVELLGLEQRGILFTSLMYYAAGRELPEMDAVTSMAFSFIRAQIDKDTKKYEETVNKRREAGRLGGLAKADNAKHDAANMAHATDAKQVQANLANATDAKQTQVNVPDNEYDNDNVNDKDKKSISRTSRFNPPTEFEVRAYCKEKGYSVDATRFIDFYASKGWMVGKNKMKDWRAAVRNWERSRRQEATAKNRFNNFSQRQYDYNSLEAQLLAQR